MYASAAVSTANRAILRFPRAVVASPIGWDSAHRREVTAAIPAVAAKNSGPPKFAKEATPELETPGLMSSTSTVPVLVPSLVQSSMP